jgi:hypothetical protein
MEYSANYGADWRLIARTKLAELGIASFDPCKDEPELLSSYGISSFNEYKLLKFKNLQLYLEIMKEIIKADLYQLELESFVVLVKLDPGCIGGAAGEVTVAKIDNIPIVGYMEDSTQIAQIPGWVLGCCDVITTSLDEAIDIVHRISEGTYI